MKKIWCNRFVGGHIETFFLGKEESWRLPWRLSKPKMDVVHALINVISGVARLKSRENYARGERSKIGHHVDIFLIPQTDKEN